MFRTALTLLVLLTALCGCQSDAEKACEHIQTLREEGSLPSMKSFDGDTCTANLEKMEEKCEYVAECIMKVEAGEPLATALKLGACTAECGAGEDAVDALKALADKACRCDGGVSCVVDAKKQAREWVETYGDAVGGDQAEAERQARRLAECEPAVALELVEAMDE